MNQETLEQAAERLYPKSSIPRKLFTKCAKWQQETHLDIKDNKIELLEEDLECIRMYLNDLKIPRTDKDDKEYSIVGRIKWQTERSYSEEEVLEILLKHQSDYRSAVRNTSPLNWSFDINKWFETFKK
jgi:hypothetical protein